MRFQKVNKRSDLYERLKALDAKVFYNCDNEFKANRDWWVLMDKGLIVAYCGMWHSGNISMLCRAWVYEPYRGKGLQRKMIDIRIRNAKGNTIITYTTPDNIVSANNLIAKGFKLYEPMYKWVGNMLYFILN